MTLLHALQKNKVPDFSPPNHVVDGLQYLVYTGSSAYGVSNDTSDLDIYGFSIPPKEMIFPHLAGQILGFGKQINRFEQYQQHHIKYNEKEYDFTIYSIVKFFQLCMDNNPNMVDVLFVPERCILFASEIGKLVRENRKIFLHKGGLSKYIGYSFSQMHKIETKNPIGKRKAEVEKYGYDVKFGYHVVRLLNEIEQILAEGDLDLERSREQLKSIRRGEWAIGQIKDYFNNKKDSLDKLYVTSSLPYEPREKEIRELLVNCLEIRFGSIDNLIKTEKSINCFINIDDARKILKEESETIINELKEKYYGGS